MSATSILETVWHPSDDAHHLALPTPPHHAHGPTAYDVSHPTLSNKTHHHHHESGHSDHRVPDSAHVHEQHQHQQQHYHHHHHHQAHRPAFRIRRHIAFTLPNNIYSWIETMAVLHNYGSVHKSIRDLLGWACTGQDEDLDWLFSRPHHNTLCMPPSLSVLNNTITNNNNNDDPDTTATTIIHEASWIAGKQLCSTRLDETASVVTLDTRVSEVLYAWICHVVSRYDLPDPSALLEAVCRCAIELHASDDIFESDECGLDLPQSTAQLYHDLGLIRYHSTPRTPPPSPPTPSSPSSVPLSNSSASSAHSS